MERKVIGLDHGNGHVKIVTNERTVVFPAAIARPNAFGEDSLTGGGLALSEFISSDYPEETYMWGADIRRASKLLPSYTGDDRYKQKNYRLLSEFSLGYVLPRRNNTEVFLVTGCPTREKGTAYEDDIIDVYGGKHAVTVNRESVGFNVENVLVVPQPVGTVMYMYLDDEGYARDISYERAYVGVIDVGSGTTDIDGVKAMKRQQADTKTLTFGMYSAYDRIASFINGENPKANATPQSVEEQVVAGNEFYRVSDRASVDISTEKERVFRELAEDIIAGINEKWTNREKFDKLLLTGGGAHVLAPYFKEWERDIIVVDDPQTANAIGFYRYGVFKARRM
jgi:plasmid segregation protein ParM